MPPCRRCLRGFPIHGLLRKATAWRRGRRPLQRGHPHLHFSRYPYIITTAQLSLRGSFRLSKKVCSPLGPLCEGAPPAGGGGENCTAVRNISGYGKVLSLRPFGAPPSQREVFRHAGGAFYMRPCCLRQVLRADMESAPTFFVLAPGQNSTFFIIFYLLIVMPKPPKGFHAPWRLLIRRSFAY